MDQPRHALRDDQWAALRGLGLFPSNGRPGRPWKDHRRVIDGILWVLHTGSPWRDLPGYFGRWKTVHGRFNRWRRDGTWDRLLTGLQAQAHAGGLLDWEMFCIDGSVVRASRAAAGAEAASCLITPAEPADHALGRSQGGFGTKVHLACDAGGLPLGVVVTPGQRHESVVFEAVMDTVAVPQAGAPPKRRPRRAAGDKAYSNKRIRGWLRRRHIGAVIPTKKDQRRRRFDKERYKGRNVVERLIGWLKERRRLATRFEKLAVNFVAMIKLAMIEKFLSILL
jgi:transposase